MSGSDPAAGFHSVRWRGARRPPARRVTAWARRLVGPGLANYESIQAPRRAHSPIPQYPRGPAAFHRAPTLARLPLARATCTRVHMGKRFSTVAALRADLGAALDRAERGETVEVERRGRLFLLSAAPQRARRVNKPWFEVFDAELLDRGWTWDYADGKVALRVGATPAERPRAGKRLGRDRKKQPIGSASHSPKQAK